MTITNVQIIGGQYKILHQIGAGGWGKTYLAEDLRRSSNKCVIKQLNSANIKPDFLEKAQELFQREGKTLLKLGNHPQIPFLFAHFPENQEFYLVQEYIEGESFRQELESKGKLDEIEVIDFLNEMLPIIQYIHENGVIHRDIKPDNIIRRQSDETLFLIDFGAVKTVFSTEGISNQSQQNLRTQILTPGYAPQEQIDGNPEFNSDIYALGMTVIRALTGIEPRNLERDRKTRIIQWRKYAAQVSDHLARIVDKMIQENSQDRYHKIRDILFDLQTTEQTEQTLILVHPSKDTQKTIINSMIQTRIPLINISLGWTFLILTPLIIIGSFVLGFRIFSFSSPLPPENPPEKQIPPSENPPEKQIPPEPEPPEQKEGGLFRLPEEHQ